MTLLRWILSINNEPARWSLVVWDVWIKTCVFVTTASMITSAPAVYKKHKYSGYELLADSTVSDCLALFHLFTRINIYQTNSNRAYLIEFGTRSGKMHKSMITTIKRMKIIPGCCWLWRLGRSNPNSGSWRYRSAHCWQGYISNGVYWSGWSQTLWTPGPPWTTMPNLGVLQTIQTIPDLAFTNIIRI